jgi:hypothetical protein
MAHRLPTMGDSRRTVSDEEIVNLLKSGLRPAWTNTTIAEELDITRQTANYRLKELEEEHEDVASISVGQATAYYVPGVSALPPGDTTEERHRQSIIQWATDKYVGRPDDPSKATYSEEGEATAGDEIQIVVEGTPSKWRQARLYGVLPQDKGREKLHDGEIIKEETQAIVSGELYAKPTVPIRHIEYPDDYDLELNLGTKYVGDPPNQPLVAAGTKRHLLYAENEAVFLTDVSVEWISPKGEGEKTDSMTLDPNGDSVESEMADEELEDLLEDVEEWQQENLDSEDYYGGNEPL